VRSRKTCLKKATSASAICGVDLRAYSTGRFDWKCVSFIFYLVTSQKIPATETKPNVKTSVLT
jgi:hypothetical protein